MRDNINGVVTPKQTVTGQLTMADHVGGTRNYNDLENKPSIEGVELVGDKTLEELNINSYLSNYPSESRVIQIVNTAIGQIAIPVNTSDLVNDSDFQTGDDVIDAIAGAISGLDIPTRTSDLINDSNYQTSDDVDGAIDKALEDLSIPTKTSDLTNDNGFQTASDVDSAIDTALEGLDIPTKVSDLTNDSGFQTASDVQSAIAAADIPTKLSDLTNDMTFQTLTEITNLINDAIGSAVGLNFEVVQTLPATGEGGTIYLVPNGGSAVVKNVYDEYIWYNGAWEKIGSTEIDLTGYIRSGTTYQNNKALMTDASGNAVTGDTTATELGYVHGVTSAIQTQINSKVDKHQTDGVDDRLMTAAEGTKLGGIASGAEENVIVGVQKNGVDLTVDANRKVDVTVPTTTSDLTNDSDFVSDANYVHTDNNYDATAKGIVDGVTAALADKVDKVNGKGLSTEDYTTAEKTKLASLQNYDDTALLGRVTAIEGVIPSGATSSNKLATASDVSGKQDTITGAATTITDTDLTASKALVSDINGKVVVSDTTATELNYVHGVTSDIQTQLNSKASTSDLSDKQDTMQFSTMPTASAANVGDIVQFTGTTTASYTNGYFYKCISEEGVLLSLPYSFNYGSAVVYHNEIHILGSAIFDSTNTAHYKWDGTNWSSVSTLPFSFTSGSAVVYNDEIHILGGNGNADSNNKLKHYKWNGSSWVSVSTLPYSFYFGSAVVYNNEIHILGGDDNNGSATITNHYKWNGSSWVSASTLPYAFGSGSAVILNGEIHIIGGQLNLIKHYKWDGSSWSSASTLLYGFINGSAVVYNNEIHLLGSGASTSDHERHYKWDGTNWSVVSTLPYQFYQGAAVTYNNEIYLLGGTNDRRKCYRWNGSQWINRAEDTYSWTQTDVQPSSGGSNYVQKTGDTMTGDLTVPNLTATGDITDGQGNSLKGSNSNLAPIEPTTTASQAYGVGDYLVYGGQLYKVTTAIASGGTIVPTGSGANVAATTVIMAINDMVGLALTASY